MKRTKTLKYKDGVDGILTIHQTSTYNKDGHRIPPRKAKTPKITDKELLAALRTAVSNYMGSEGCECCRDIDAHAVHTKELAKLLRIPKYKKTDTYDFAKYRTGQ